MWFRRWVVTAAVFFACGARAHSAEWWIPPAMRDTTYQWPSVARCGEGYIIAAVREMPSGAEIVCVAVDSTGRAQGPIRLIAHSAERSSMGPPCAARTADGASIVWEQSNRAWSRVWRTRVSALGQPDTPQPVSYEFVRTRGALPRVAPVTGFGDEFIVWTEWTSTPPCARAVWWRGGRPAGREWRICSSTGAISAPDCAAGANGVALAWIEGDGTERVMTGTIAPLDTVVVDRMEASDSGVLVHRARPRIMWDDRRGAVLVWSEAEDARLRVALRSIGHDGMWNALQHPGSGESGHELAPCVSVASGNALLCVWEEADARVVGRVWGASGAESVAFSEGAGHTPSVAGAACAWIEDGDAREARETVGVRGIVLRPGTPTGPVSAPSSRALAIRSTVDPATFAVDGWLERGDRIAVVRPDGRRVGKDIVVEDAGSASRRFTVDAGDHSIARSILFAVIMRHGRPIASGRIPPYAGG